MKTKFNAKNYKNFIKELNNSDEKRAKELIEEYVFEYRQTLLGLYDGDDAYDDDSEEIKGTILMAESPIERIFYIAAKNEMMNQTLFNANEFFAITPQKEVKARHKNYRVDFSLSYFNESFGVVDIFVELNGHEYHNATKKKVTADRQRERALQNHCDRLMTFTGTEIYNDPDECAREVFKSLYEAIKRRVAKHDR